MCPVTLQAPEGRKSKKQSCMLRGELQLNGGKQRQQRLLSHSPGSPLASGLSRKEFSRCVGLATSQRLCPAWEAAFLLHPLASPRSSPAEFPAVSAWLGLLRLRSSHRGAVAPLIRLHKSASGCCSLVSLGFAISISLGAQRGLVCPSGDVSLSSASLSELSESNRLFQVTAPFGLTGAPKLGQTG